MLEGAMEPKTIASRAAMLGFPAIALTDRNGLYGAMPFSDACRPRASSRSSARCSRWRGRPRSAARGDRLAGAAGQGRAGLCQSVETGVVGPSRPPARGGAACRVRHARWPTDGLIALTAGAEGALARLLADGQRAKAEDYLDRLQALFPDRLYIEISRAATTPVEEAAENALIELAYARDLPLVATNPAGYPEPEFPCRA